jgi:signal transduction histidine kinase
MPPYSEMKFGFIPISARARNALVFFSALLLLSLGGLVTYLTIVRLLDAQRWVAHTREVQSALSNIGNTFSRAGRSRVEYVRSGDAARLDEYHSAVSDTQQAITLVRQLTADNNLQQNYCARLESWAKRRIALMDQSINSKQHDQASLEKEAEITQGVVGTAAEMDSVVQQMQGLEDQLLAEREARSQALFRQAVLLCSAAFLFAVLLLGLHYYLLNHELKARQRADESLRRLNARLLEIQDEERRRISQELHESLGQYLSGVKMNLEIVSKSLPPNLLLKECVAILDKSISETRTMSHLLHPPLLDEVGFASAARWYVEGFSEHNEVVVELTLPEKFGRLPRAIELALFRVLQESLTNIARHSGARRAQITVRWQAGEVELRVKDNGKGIPSGVLERFETNSGYLGVGLTGMRERLRELGGRMEVHSDATGTLIVAVLPIAGSHVKAGGTEVSAREWSKS